MSEVTRLIEAAAAGDQQAAASVLPLVYDELRKLAAVRLADEQSSQTLQPTALVHEAYVRVVGGGQPDRWHGRGHFFAVAAEAMRRILVERARRRSRGRHGGGRRRVDLDPEAIADDVRSDDLLALDEALDKLATEEPQVAAVVKLRYFAGLTLEDTAGALGVSLRTANRHWAYAKAWLFEALHEDA